MESFSIHFKGENVSLSLEAAMLEELEWMIGRQMRYYNRECRHSSLGYQLSMAYLVNEGIVPKVLPKNVGKTGSAPGAQLPYPPRFPVFFCILIHTWPCSA